MDCFQGGSEFYILLYQTSNHRNLISKYLMCWCMKLSNYQILMIWWIKLYQKSDVSHQIWWIKIHATHQNSVVSHANCHNRPSKYLMIWWIKYLTLISKSNLIWWFDASTYQIFDVIYQNIKSDGSNIWYWYQNQIWYWYQNQIIWLCNFDRGEYQSYTTMIPELCMELLVAPPGRVN